MLFVGEIVKTPYGVAKVVELNSRNVVVQPVDWTMAGGQKPTYYMNELEVKPIYHIGDSVYTAYGDAVIENVRAYDQMYELTLKNWKLATGKSPRLFMKCTEFNNQTKPQSNPTPPIELAPATSVKVGDEVSTAYGVSIVTAVRENGAIVATPKIWRLAYNQEPTFYLNKDSYKLVEHKEESNVRRGLARAIELKETATEAFKAGDIEKAREQYSQAVMILNYLGTDLTNDDKAALFEQTVPCNNNLALCTLKLQKYNESLTYANTSLTLIEALEKKLSGESKVWECLVARGVTKAQLQQQWKRRSLYLLGKACVGLGECDEAVNYFKRALKLVINDPARAADVKELKQLIASATKRAEKDRKAAKNMWSKAFKKRGEEGVAEEEAATAAALRAAAEAKPSSTGIGGTSSTSRTSLSSSNTSPASVGDISNMDLSQFGIGKPISAKAAQNTAESKKNSNVADSSAVALKTPSWLPYVFVTALAGFGVFAYSYFRFRK